MKSGKLEECIIGKTNIKEIDFDEKLNVILTGVNKRKEEEEIKRKEEEAMNKKMKEINNERKIDFFLNKNGDIDTHLDIESVKGNDVHNHCYDNNYQNQKQKKDLFQSELNNNNEIIKECPNKGMKIHNSIEEDEDYIIKASPSMMEFKDLIKTSNPIIKPSVQKQKSNNNTVISANKKASNLPQSPIIDSDEIIQMAVIQPKIFKTQIKIDDMTKQLLTTKQQQLNNSNNNINNTISSIHSIPSINNESKLLLEYKKEKQINHQLNNILTNNISVLKNSQFSITSDNIMTNNNINATTMKNKQIHSFYQTESTLNKLSQARKLLEEKLTIREKEAIHNATNQLSSLTEEHNILLKDRKKIESSLKIAKDDYMKFKTNREREIINDQRKNLTILKGIVNKYKLDLYQNELKPKTEKYAHKEIKSELEALKEEIEQIKAKIKQSDLNHKTQVKKCQNELQEYTDKNAVLLMKIKSYEEDRLWNEISTQKSLISTVNQLTNVINTNITNKIPINSQQYDKKGKIKEVVINDDDLFTGVKVKPVRGLYDDDDKDYLKKYNPYEHTEEFDLIFKDKYHKNHEVIIKEEFQGNGIIVKEFSRGKRELLFPSGQRKEIFLDGYQVIYYKNGDIKQIFPNDDDDKKNKSHNEGKELYYYSSQKTVQLKYSDGRNYLKFPDGHIENLNKLVNK